MIMPEWRRGTSGENAIDVGVEYSSSALGVRVGSAMGEVTSLLLEADGAFDRFTAFAVVSALVADEPGFGESAASPPPVCADF